MDEFHARRLVDLYADTILRISYSYLKQTCDAEDICQTVFLKYLTNDCTFDSIDHEKAWIIRTTINACKDYLKSAHFRRTVALDEENRALVIIDQTKPRRRCRTRKF
jgi:RNA polymerase sigma factor (sigma-70 family)